MAVTSQSTKGQRSGAELMISSNWAEGRVESPGNDLSEDLVSGNG